MSPPDASRCELEDLARRRAGAGDRGRYRLPRSRRVRGNRLEIAFESGETRVVNASPYLVKSVFVQRRRVACPERRLWSTSTAWTK